MPQRAPPSLTSLIFTTATNRGGTRISIMWGVAKIKILSNVIRLYKKNEEFFFFLGGGGWGWGERRDRVYF